MSRYLSEKAPPQSAKTQAPQQPVQRFAFTRALRLWSETECLSRGAAVSFYTATTLVPICGVVIGIMALWFGQDAAVERFALELARVVGPSATAAVTAIANQAKAGSASSWGAVIGIALTIFGATTVLAEMSAAFNAIWSRAGAFSSAIAISDQSDSTTVGATIRAVWRFIRTRVLALAALVSLAFILLASTLLTAMAGLVVDAALRWTGQQSTVTAALSVQTIGFVTSVLVTWLAMLAIFRMLLPVRLDIPLLLKTVFMATALFFVGRVSIGLYLDNVPQLDSYGAAASLVVLMLWLYYAAQIVLISACMAAVQTLAQEP
jgi:membrane protein